MNRNATQTTERYNRLSIGFHWITVLLLIAVYACIELRVFYPKGSDPREMLKAWHFMLGLSVLLITLARLGVRIYYPSPAAIGHGLQALLARVLHLALYALLIALPIMGWLYLSAKGKPIPFFGLEMPALIAPNDGLAEIVEELHETGGTVGYFLIGIHALAALAHHYVLKDNTLLRMLPKRS